MSIEHPSAGEEAFEPLPGRRESLQELDRRIPAMTQKTRTTLAGVENVWQPSEFLPNFSEQEKAFEQVRSLQTQTRALPPEVLAVLIGDAVTEEGLPTFTSRLFTAYGLPAGQKGDVHVHDGNLQKWIREWTSEEHRHGVLLNAFLRLSGRVDMPAYERTVQLFLKDGMDIEIGNDPYRGFVYTSFQELATQRSHANVARLAVQHQNPMLAKICGQIAADEGYHAKAYIEFVRIIFERDPDRMMVALQKMTERGVVMPAHNMREVDKSGKLLQPGETFAKFSDVAQQIGVYTSKDYADISGHILSQWKVGQRSEAGWQPLPVQGLGEEGVAAQQAILKRQRVIERLVDRQKPKQPEKHEWSWLIQGK